MLIANIRVDWHDADERVPIAAPILPLAGSLTRPVSFRVHWSGGNHVLVRQRVADEDDVAPDFRALAGDLAEWIVAQPAADGPALSAWETSTLAGIEQLDAVEPLRANRTVALTCEPEPPYLGSELLSPVRVRFDETAGVEILNHYRRGGSGACAARLTLLLAEVAALYRAGGMAHGVRSLHAHGRSFLSAQPRFAANFENFYQRSRDQIGPAVAEILAGSRERDGLLASVEACGEELDSIGARTPEAILGAGSYNLSSEDGNSRWRVAAARWVPARVLESSEEERLAFGRHRTLINFSYTLFPLCAINTIGRFAAAYVAARSVSEQLGLDDAYFQIPPEEKLC